MKSYGMLPEEPAPEFNGEDIARFNANARWQFRIEAVRAASRIVAGALTGGYEERKNSSGVKEYTIALAKHIARYIETGE